MYSYLSNGKYLVEFCDGIMTLSIDYQTPSLAKYVENYLKKLSRECKKKGFYFEFNPLLQAPVIKPFYLASIRW